MNQKQQSIKVNFIMNALLTMSSLLFPLITFPYVSRVLLPVGTGKVAFATSLISYFNMFAQLGIPTYGIRACAKVRDNREELSRTVHELLFLNVIMGMLSYAVLIVVMLFVPRVSVDRPLYIVMSLTIILNAIGIEWLYKGLEQYTYITVRSIIFKAIAVVAMFAMVKKVDDYIIYGAISIFAASASNILNFFNARKYVAMKPIGGYNLRRHYKAVAIFFAMACATTIYTNLDTVMLGFMKDDAEVGYYNAAVKIKGILVSIVTALGTVLLPRASYYVEHKLMKEFREIANKALNFVMVIAVPMVVYFVIFAEPGIYFLSGKEYTGSIVPMQVIMPTLLLIGLTNILGIQILVPLGKERTVLLSVVAGAVVDLVINAVLIPPMGATGAAIGTLVAEFVVLIVQMVALREQVWEAFREMQLVKILFALLVAVLASVWILEMELGVFLVLLISAVIFFAIYGVALLISREKFTVQCVNQIVGRFLKKSK